MNPTANNGNGGLLTVRGKSKRMSAVDISHRGVPITVQYLIEGGYLFATETDPADTPQCLVQIVETGGVDITRLLSDERLNDIAEQIEGEWK